MPYGARKCHCGSSNSCFLFFFALCVCVRKLCVHAVIYLFICICFVSCQWIIDAARHFTDCYCLDKTISSALLTFINSNFVVIDKSAQRFCFYQEARGEKLHVKEKTLDIPGCASPLWSLFCFGDFYDKRYLNTLAICMRQSVHGILRTLVLKTSTVNVSPCRMPAWRKHPLLENVGDLVACRHIGTCISSTLLKVLCDSLHIFKGHVMPSLVSLYDTLKLAIWHTPLKGYLLCMLCNNNVTAKIGKHQAAPGIFSYLTLFLSISLAYLNGKSV